MAAEAFGGSSTGLARGLSKLREEGLFCDVFFAAEGAGDSRHRWVGAHQVVLAASNTGFRTRLASDAATASLTAPEPLEVQMRGISRIEAVEAAVVSAYGLGETPRAPAECSRDLQMLAEGLQVCGNSRAKPGDATAEMMTAMARELRSMRQRGHLCDIVLVVGEHRLHAHQAVLAAASAGLKQYISEHQGQLLSKVATQQELGLFASPASVLPNTMTAQPLELELQGISHKEAVLSMLDHVYGDESSLALLPTDPGPLQDLVTLAGALELPTLRDAAAKQLAAGSEPEPSSKPGVAPEQEEPKAPPAIQVARFDDEELPEAVPDLPKLGAREGKVLEKLFDAFEERPLWLELPLAAQLPASVTAGSDILAKLLPFVCYRWKDGPWKNAYCRLGFDPREDEEDAKWLQVIYFRDPHFTPPKVAEVADHTFRRPPSEKVQPYQLLDIRDDFVHTLVKGSDSTGAVDRKTGWLPQVMMEAVMYRLQLKSFELRQKPAAGRGGKAAAGRGLAGPRAKKARVGGA